MLCSKAEAATRKRLSVAGGTGKGERRLNAAAASVSGGRDDMADSGMSVNPFLLRQAIKPIAGGEGTDLTSSGMDPKEVATMMSPPNEAMWAAIRSSYSKLAGMTDDLRKEVRESKKAADTTISPTAPASRARTRQQFSPVLSGDGDGDPSGSHATRELLTSFANPAASTRVKMAASPGVSLLLIKPNFSVR